MDKLEFIQTCIMGGYCDKETATQYAEDKNELSDADIIAVFRIHEEKADREKHSQHLRYYQGAKSSKQFKYSEV